MNTAEPVLIDHNTTVETVMKMGDGYIIVGGPKEQVIGTLDFLTMFIWTSREKAEDFIHKNLDPAENKVIEKPISKLLEEARNLGFSIVRFDFQAKGCHPKQAFVNYPLLRQGILDLLPVFNSL